MERRQARAAIERNMRQGDFDAALTLAERLANRTGSTQDCRMFGEVLARSGRLERAAKVFDELIQKDPDSNESAAIQVFLAEILTRLGQTEAAVEQWHVAYEASDRETVAMKRDAALVQLGKLEEARTSIDAAWLDHPESLLIRSRLAAAMLRDDELEAATECAQAVIEQDPNHSVAHGILGQALLGRGMIDKAIDHLEKCIKTDPGNLENTLALVRALQSQGKERLSEAFADQASAAATSETDAKPHSEPDWVHRCELLIALDRLSEALQVSEAATRSNPGVSWAWRLRAVVLAQAKAKDEEILDALAKVFSRPPLTLPTRRAVKRIGGPKVARLAASIAKQLRDDGKARPADDLLDMAESLSRELGTERNRLAILRAERARTAVRAGDLTAAKDLFEQALALADDDDDANPTLVLVAIDLGRLMARLHRLDDAEAALREAVRRAAALGDQGGPARFEATLALARMLLLRGNADEAKLVARRAAQVGMKAVGPMSLQMARLFSVMGDIALAGGDEQQAMLNHKRSRSLRRSLVTVDSERDEFGQPILEEESMPDLDPEPSEATPPTVTSRNTFPPRGQAGQDNGSPPADVSTDQGEKEEIPRRSVRLARRPWRKE